MSIPTDEPPLDQPYEGAPWGAAYRRFWKKGVTFSGRASRAEFWRSWVLVNGVITVLYLFFGIARFLDPLREFANFVVVIALLYALAALLPSLAVTVRRLHDTNQSGAAYFVSLIPLIGGFILLGMLAQPARPEGARFDLPSSAPVRPEPQALASSYGEIAVAPREVAPASTLLPPVLPPPSPSFSAAAAAMPPVAPAAPRAFTPAPAARPVAPAAVPVAPASSGIPGASASISGIPGIPSSFAPAAPALDDDLGSTRVVAPRNASGWSLELPDGRRLGIDGTVSLGRDPVSESGGVLVPIDDPARSMSKTHARFDLTDTGVTVTDLHSTNGTRIEVPGAATVSLPPGVATPVPEGGAVLLGEYVVRLRRR